MPIEPPRPILKGLRCGESAVLVEVAAGTATAWARALADRPLPDLVESVPAESTLLVRTSGPVDIERVVEHLRRIEPRQIDYRTAPLVTIDVTYDGPDLADVAQACALTADQVVQLHTAAEFVVAFCGFAPGFAYLAGLPAKLALPRRDTPRTAVPAGSVAIAAKYSAVYPHRSPGGWHLLGSTGTTLFDPDATRPALLTPGTRVRFRSV